MIRSLFLALSLGFTPTLRARRDRGLLSATEASSGDDTRTWVKVERVKVDGVKLEELRP